MVAVMLPSLCQRHETVCFEMFRHMFDGFRLGSTKHESLSCYLHKDDQR